MTFLLVGAFISLAVFGVGIDRVYRVPGDNWAMIAAGGICLVLVCVAFTIVEAMKAHQPVAPSSNSSH